MAAQISSHRPSPIYGPKLLPCERVNIPFRFVLLCFALQCCALLCLAFLCFDLFLLPPTNDTRMLRAMRRLCTGYAALHTSDRRKEKHPSHTGGAKSKPVRPGCGQKQASHAGLLAVQLGTSSNRRASAATFFMRKLHSLSSRAASEAQRVLKAASSPRLDSKNLLTSAQQALCTVTSASRSRSNKNPASFLHVVLNLRTSKAAVAVSFSILAG